MTDDDRKGSTSTMSSTPIGVAVIGAGMAGRAHCAGYRTAPTLFDPPLPPIRYAAVVDANEAVAKDAAGRYGYERAGTEWRALLDDDDVHVVSVVVANALHREIAEALLAAGNEGERNDQELIQALTRLLNSSPAAANPAEPAATPAPPAPSPVVAAPPELAVAHESPGAVAAAPPPPPAPPIAALPPVAEPAASAIHDASQKSEPKHDHADAPADRGEHAAADPAAQSQSRTAASESSIRVDVALLDKLMNLVGELVLARNQILQFTHAT